MLSAGMWQQYQPNTILFVLVDNTGNEVAGLGSAFTLSIAKSGGSFSGSTGTKSEIGSGWYKYVSTAEEADTSGPLAVVITGVGIVQQNLEYVVTDRVEVAIPFTYTVTSSLDSVPIPDVAITIYGDSGGNNIVWTGKTDISGVARDTYGQVPRLVASTYYIWRLRNGYLFQNPDVEVVS